MSEPRTSGPAVGWFLGCLAIMAVGLLLVAVDQAYRLGTVLIGAGALLAGWLRAFLPADRAGLLAIRGRTVDVTAYLLLGLAIVVAALIVPA